MKRMWKNLAVAGAALALTGPMVLLPANADAQTDRRQKTKNEWRNIATAAGALALLGLLKDDPTLTFGGTVGALYAAWRYEEDRKSQNKERRLRAAYFSRSHFYRDGYKYTRRTKWKDGKKYYYFTRAKVRSQ